MGRTEWTSEHDFTLDGVAYRAMENRSSPDQMVLLKPRDLVAKYEAMVEELQPRAIFELGIYRGGSAAFLAQLARPDKLVAVDLEPRPCEPLERFIEERGLRGVVVPHYGVDQGDVGALEAIMDQEFDGPLDLVIDDASHLEAQTRASFNCLFPRLRPGGLYIIEDWAWPHVAGVKEDLEYQGVTPISVLVCQLVLAAARRRKAFPEVTVGFHWTAVRRGDADLTPGVFDLSKPFDPVGLEMVEAMMQVKTESLA
jgi:predicted O-methyltransferase YrrM